jgi:hypothetical protein
MLVKIKHIETQVELEIRTASYDPDDLAELTIEAPILEETFKRELNQSYGFYGHKVNSASVTNLDLSYAVGTLPSFEVLEIEPIVTPNKLPDNAVS